MDLKKMHELFGLCWLLYKAGREDKLSDETCDEFRDNTSRLYVQLGMDEFAKDLIVLVADEVDRIWREQHGKS